MEENYSSMLDFYLIDNFRDLFNFMFNRFSDIEEGDYLIRFRKGDIVESLLDFMMG